MGSDDLEKLVGKDEESARDRQVSALEDEIQSLKNSRKEERFLFILAAVIALDFHVFHSSESWGYPIAILVLELLFLIPVARMCGVDEFVVWMNKLLNVADKKTD